MKKNRTKGFSLIELMVTVVIIGILASIALPAYTDQVRKARRADGLDALLDCAAQQARNYSTSSPLSYYTSATAQDASACGWDGSNFVSKDGHYTLAITNPENGCSSGASIWCYLLTITPTGSQADDTSCATMSIDHRGIKAAEDNTSTDSTDICWRN